jgi:hypothetical protein
MYTLVFAIYKMIDQFLNKITVCLGDILGVSIENETKIITKQIEAIYG